MAAKKQSIWKPLLIAAGVVGGGYLLVRAVVLREKRALFPGPGGPGPDGPLLPPAPGGEIPSGRDNFSLFGGSSCSKSGVLTARDARLPSETTMQNPAVLRDVFAGLTKLYGADIARNVEKIYRLETAHFKSGQYLFSGSPGMVATTGSYPYGWKSLESFWTKNPGAKPLGLASFCVNGKVFNYLIFKDSWGFFALAEILKKRGRPGSWYSTVPEEQAGYESKLNQIRSQYV